MCDIVNSPCKVCGVDLPLHLGDYETGRNEVECYCGDHLPDRDVRVFTLKENSYQRKYVQYESPNGLGIWYARGGYNIDYHEGWRMGIRDLTDNARKWKKYNHPNIGVDWVEEEL